MGGPIVRCPSCSLVLEVPNGAPKFRCPCGLVLTSPVRRPSQPVPAPPRSLNEDHLISTNASSTQATIHRPSNVNDVQDLSQALEVPPVETEDSSRSDCEICFSNFTILKRRHHCRSCGALVCGSCSDNRWPSNMLPPAFNHRNEKVVRICKHCHGSMERFRGYCLQGNVVAAKKEYSSGLVRLSCPYSIYPNSLFPIHCAATSGSIELVQWMIDKGCFIRVTDGRGFTPLAAAAQKGQLDLVKYLIQKGYSTVEEITDRHALQQCLLAAIAIQPSIQRSSSSSAYSIPPPPYPGPASSIPPPAYPSAPMTTASSIPAPKDEMEEEEQMKIALTLSKAMDNYTNNSAVGTPALATSTTHDQALEAEKGTGECIICFDAPIQTCFVPCGHSCACVTCAEQFKSNCPVCRGKVDQVIRTYNISSLD